MKPFDEVFDFVVVGSGGGSLCAGLYLRERQYRVLVLEKTHWVGGTTARSGGVMWIPNNPFMHRDGVEDSEALAATYLDTVIGEPEDAPGTSAIRRRTYLREAPRMLAFLMAQGIRFDRVSSWPDYYDTAPGGSVPGRAVVAAPFDASALGVWRDKLRGGFLPMPATLEEMLQLPYIRRAWAVKWLALKIALRVVWAKLSGRHWVSAGAALQGRMLEAALKAGVEIRTETPVEELIVEDGKVTGVLTRRNGRPWRIGSRLGVLMNAGGFARNQRLRDRYQPGTSAAWTMAAEGDTGEMIEEMARHGAALAQMEEMVGNQITLPPGAEDADFKPGVQRHTAAPHAILVDQSGVRYMNEGGSYMAYCKGMLERHKTVPAVPSWAIFDAQFLRKYMVAGTLPSRRQLRRWQSAGYLRRGTTIEDLARQLHIDPERLAATVQRFNGFVAQDRDEDFHRGESAYDRWLGDRYHGPSPTLGTIEQAPFYAIPVLPGDVGTFGGVVTDEYSRVLREDGSVIQGLYATGVSTASVMGRAYPGPGCSVGPSFTWGYVAACHAAAQQAPGRIAQGAGATAAAASEALQAN